MVDRVKSGIPGLDELISGGFVRNSVMLISGSAGSGKTIFCLQFLVNGAQNGDKGLYITFEESKNDVLAQAQAFKWPLEELENKGMLKILTFSPSKTHFKLIDEEITRAIDDFKPARVVYDSISAIAIYAEVLFGIEIMQMTGQDAGKKGYQPSGRAVMRRAVMDIVGRLKNSGATSLITSELPIVSKWYSRDTVSEFVSDGVIKLSKIEALGKRTLTVEKIRATKHDPLAKNVVISDSGIGIEKLTK